MKSFLTGMLAISGAFLVTGATMAEGKNHAATVSAKAKQAAPTQLLGPNERTQLIGPNQRMQIIGPNDRTQIIGPNERIQVIGPNDRTQVTGPAFLGSGIKRVPAGRVTDPSVRPGDRRIRR